MKSSQEILNRGVVPAVVSEFHGPAIRKGKPLQEFSKAVVVSFESGRKLKKDGTESLFFGKWVKMFEHRMQKARGIGI